jgi:hypothetical protein
LTPGKLAETITRPEGGAVKENQTELIVAGKEEKQLPSGSFISRLAFVKVPFVLAEQAAPTVSGVALHRLSFAGAWDIPVA